MKICVISTTVIPCPPSGYAGLEMISWLCADGLKKKGHDVLLIAPKGSKTEADLHETTIMEQERQAYSGYWDKLDKYDVIIDHSWEKWSYILKMEGKLKAPVLGVMHAPVHTMYTTPPPIDKPSLVCISKDQAEGCMEHLKKPAEVCYNGVDVAFYSNKAMKRNNRYLFLARMSTIKGPDIAVEVAKKTKIGLDLVGDDKITGEPALAQKVKAECNINPKLRYVGGQNRSECSVWFNTNKALLHPNKLFREPFGLAPVESQLCGMPVIAWDNGAMRETVKHGETGFLVKSEDEMIDLIKADAVKKLKASDCEEWARQFSYENMVNRYEELAIKAKDTGGW
jgi:glycosyltransferase involved in cell wall biosynthesis